ncbi:MAG: VOC family protein [Ekhidna sp.]
MRYLLLLLPCCLLLIACSKSDDAAIANFETLCEMVANDAKPIGISPPLTENEVNANWDVFDQIAKKWDLNIYRDNDFPITALWPSSITKNKEVVLVYKHPRLVQYLQLKDDLKTIDPIQAARRLGRMLGYSSLGINRLLADNSSFRTLNSFGVNAQVTHLYYEDVVEANQFYGDVLGLQALEDNRYQISEDAIIQLNAFDETHPADQSLSTAIALLTDQLPEWYVYLQEAEVPIKYTYKPRDGGPHDGFVAVDPGGYFLEFELFKQHPENELFVAYLEESPKVMTKIDSMNFYGSITWTYHNDLLKMQSFYEEHLGFELVADQGWTKIYRTSPTGFIGLVDERRGMMDYADEKAVEVEWEIEDKEGAIQYFSENDGWESSDELLLGPEKYRYSFR